MMNAATNIRGAEIASPMVATRPQIAAGSVAIVPPQPQEVPSASAPDPTAGAAGPEEAVAPEDNPITDYITPDPTVESKQAFLFLIQNIDFGISEGHSPDIIFTKAISPLSKEVKDMLGEFGEDGIIDFIEKQVPPAWKITSIAGEEVVRQCFRMLTP